MRSIKIDPHSLGFTADEVATAGRVAMAVHRAAYASVPDAKASARSSMAKFAVGDAMMRAGGWQTQTEASRKWKEWLRDAKRCTVAEAHAARIRLAGGAMNISETRRSKIQTSIRLAMLEDEGLVRYVRADRFDPGLVVWLGDP